MTQSNNAGIGNSISKLVTTIWESPGGKPILFFGFILYLLAYGDNINALFELIGCQTIIWYHSRWLLIIPLLIGALLSIITIRMWYKNRLLEKLLKADSTAVTRKKT